MKLNKSEIILQARYLNAKLNKHIIYKENKNKCGVYRWTNLVNGKSYIGSSTSLYNRFRVYFSLGYLNNVRTGSSIISKALLKYGFKNFSLGIIEYCNPDLVITREQYYLDKLKPEYNICKIAGSSFGYKHKKETILKFKNRIFTKEIKAKMRAAAKNRIITEEMRAKWRAAAKLRRGIKHNIEFSINLSKAKRGTKCKPYIKSNKNIEKKKEIKSETRLKLSLRGPGVSVKIFDRLNNLIKEFPTKASAAKFVGVWPSTISKIFETGISYDNYVYKFEVKDTRVWVCNLDRKLIKILSNVKKASEWCNIPYTTLSRYIKSGKLYKNKYYFYNVNSTFKPY
jgi:group I intron endonuclease